jgi:hypothetical protein
LALLLQRVFAADWPPETFATLGERLAQASAALATLDPAEVDGFEGQPMAFRVGDHVADFTAEQFLLTFSVPNFYFHVTTAYAILRMKDGDGREHVAKVRTHTPPPRTHRPAQHTHTRTPTPPSSSPLQVKELQIAEARGNDILFATGLVQIRLPGHRA